VDSRWSLMFDLVSARALVWIAKWGRDSELTADAHVYFFDRYRRLAAVHRSRGQLDKAKSVEAKAEKHYRPGYDDGPPYAAAMAMPRPRRWIQTDMISKSHLDGPDDAA
jgi:hypothetical protein